MAAKRRRPHSSVAQDEERLPAWAVQRARSAGAMGSDGIGMPHDDARRDGNGMDAHARRSSSVVRAREKGSEGADLNGSCGALFAVGKREVRARTNDSFVSEVVTP